VTTRAKLYISWIAAAGLLVLVAGLSHWQSTGLPRLLAFLFLGVRPKIDFLRTDLTREVIHIGLSGTVGVV